MTALNLGLKKILVAVFFGAVLFVVSSFAGAGVSNASPLFCDACGVPGAQTMIASYYGPGLAGNPTASGEIFDPGNFTAAHRTLPFGTRLLVSRGGRSVVVTVNDRGPYVGGRDLDLSLAAAEEIGLTGPGFGPVEVTIL